MTPHEKHLRQKQDLEDLINNSEISPEIWARLGMRITEAEKVTEERELADAGFTVPSFPMSDKIRKRKEAYNEKIGFVPREELERAREWESHISPTAKKDGGEFIRTSGEFEIELEIYIAEDGTRSITGFKGRKIDEVS